MKNWRRTTLGLLGFVSGATFGSFAFPSRTHAEANDKLPASGTSGRQVQARFEAERSRVRERSVKAGNGRKDGEMRVFFDHMISDLSPEQQAETREKLGPLLKEAGGIGIGEYGYSSIAYLAISEAAREDPEGTFHQFLEMGDVSMRESYYNVILSEWLLKDPVAAGKAVRDLPPGTRKDVLNRVLFDVTQIQDPAEAFHMVKGMKDASPADYYKIFKNWAKDGVGAAAANISSIDNEEMRLKAISGIAATYTESQPQEAWLWAQRLEGESRDNALANVLDSRLDKDFPEAVQAVKSLESADLRGKLVLWNMPKIAQKDVEGAYKLACETLSGRDLNDASSAIVATEFTKENLPAIQKVVESVSLGEYREQLVVDFTRKWVEIDPAAAHEWLEKNGDINSVPEDLKGKLSGKSMSSARSVPGIVWGEYSK